MIGSNPYFPACTPQYTLEIALPLASIGAAFPGSKSPWGGGRVVEEGQRCVCSQGCGTGRWGSARRWG